MAFEQYDYAFDHTGPVLGDDWTENNETGGGIGRSSGRVLASSAAQGSAILELLPTTSNLTIKFEDASAGQATSTVGFIFRAANDTDEWDDAYCVKMSTGAGAKVYKLGVLQHTFPALTTKLTASYQTFQVLVRDVEVSPGSAPEVQIALLDSAGEYLGSYIDEDDDRIVEGLQVGLHLESFSGGSAGFGHIYVDTILDAGMYPDEGTALKACPIDPSHIIPEKVLRVNKTWEMETNYEQRIPKHEDARRVWTLTWIVDQADRDIMSDFFDDMKGAIHAWTFIDLIRNDVNTGIFADSILQIVRSGPGQFTLTALVREVFVSPYKRIVNLPILGIVPQCDGVFQPYTILDTDRESQYIKLDAALNEGQANSVKLIIEKNVTVRISYVRGAILESDGNWNIASVQGSHFGGTPGSPWSIYHPDQDSGEEYYGVVFNDSRPYATITGIADAQEIEIWLDTGSYVDREGTVLLSVCFTNDLCASPNRSAPDKIQTGDGDPIKPAAQHDAEAEPASFYSSDQVQNDALWNMWEHYAQTLKTTNLSEPVGTRQEGWSYSGPVLTNSPKKVVQTRHDAFMYSVYTKVREANFPGIPESEQHLVDVFDVDDFPYRRGVFEDRITINPQRHVADDDADACTLHADGYPKGIVYLLPPWCVPYLSVPFKFPDLVVTNNPSGNWEYYLRWVAGAVSPATDGDGINAFGLKSSNLHGAGGMVVYGDYQTAEQLEREIFCDAAAATTLISEPYVGTNAGVNQGPAIGPLSQPGDPGLFRRHPFYTHADPYGCLGITPYPLAQELMSGVNFDDWQLLFYFKSAEVDATWQGSLTFAIDIAPRNGVGGW